jgi:hypothetical protein
MDLTINDIIQYVTNNLQYINEPEILQDDVETDVISNNITKIFGKNIQHIPSLYTVNITTRNISFISSIFMALDEKFPDKEYDQIEIVEQFIKQLYKSIKTSKFEYAKYNITLKAFSNMVKTLEINNILFHYIAHILHINIFIVDNGITYIGETYNKYKKNIFLLKITNEIYEPLISVDTNIKNIISKITYSINL